jgi:hypothetical protein
MLASALLLFFVPTSASAAASPEAKPAGGVLVTFRDAVPNDEMHTRLGTRLIYRAERLRTDHVIALDAKKAAEPAALLRLCARYAAEGPVVDCEPNLRIEPAEHDEAPPSDVTKPHPIDTSCPLPETKIVPKDLAEKFQRRGLTPFWAQTYVGATPAKKLYTQWDTAEPLLATSAAVLDAGFFLDRVNGRIGGALEQDRQRNLGAKHHHPESEHRDAKVREDAAEKNLHGTVVANLKNDPVVGGGVGVKLDRLEILSDSDDALRIANELGQLGVVLPQVVNLALNLDDARGKPLSRLARRGIFVLSGGNRYPFPVNGAKSGLPAVRVASLDPSGYISDFSSPGDSLTVAAPSDRWLLARDGEKFLVFGGTSGAAPLVEGAIDMTVSLLGPKVFRATKTTTGGFAPRKPGYDTLSTTEAERLLRFTALPTIPALRKQNDAGGGALNTLRLVAVAKRLRALDWSNLAPSQREKLLEDHAVMDFTRPYKNEDAETWKRDFDPKTQLQRGIELAANCAGIPEAIEHLQKAFLLTECWEPSKGEAAIAKTAREKLAELYRRLGYPANAAFYENFDAEAFLGNALRDANPATQSDAKIRAAAIRTVGSLTGLAPNARVNASQIERARTAVKQAFRDPAPEVRAAAALEAVHLEPKEVVKMYDELIKKELADYQGNSVLSAVIMGAAMLPEEAGFPVLKKLIEGRDGFARGLAAEAAAMLRLKGPTLLDLAIGRGDTSSVRGAIRGAATRPDDGYLFLEKIIRGDDDPELRLEALMSATRVPFGYAATFAAIFDEDPDVSAAALKIARLNTTAYSATSPFVGFSLIGAPTIALPIGTAVPLALAQDAWQKAVENFVDKELKRRENMPLTEVQKKRIAELRKIISEMHK